jgi:DNA excision repair protein ERCC-2
MTCASVLQDLRQFGRKKGWCPYYLTRHMIGLANVVVYNYQYMLDPKVSQIVRTRSHLCCLALLAP